VKIRDVMKLVERDGWLLRNQTGSNLPGCVAAGDTVEETERLMRDAIEMHLAGMREDGEPIPEPTTKAGMLPVESVA